MSADRHRRCQSKIDAAPVEWWAENAIMRTLASFLQLKLCGPSARLNDLAIDERAQVTAGPSVRALFILAGQAAVPSHIGRKDGG
jgi:hypothetical protein